MVMNRVLMVVQHMQIYRDGPSSSCMYNPVREGELLFEHYKKRLPNLGIGLTVA